MRTIWFVAGVVGLLASLVFLWWTIQTGWSGSFPGRDVETYTRWAIAQFAAFIACLAFAVHLLSALGRDSLAAMKSPPNLSLNPDAPRRACGPSVVAPVSSVR
jgi:hypothetical protein